jgi:hypothetical protein
MSFAISAVRLVAVWFDILLSGISAVVTLIGLTFDAMQPDAIVNKHLGLAWFHLIVGAMAMSSVCAIGQIQLQMKV